MAEEITQVPEQTPQTPQYFKSTQADSPLGQYLDASTKPDMTAQQLSDQYGYVPISEQEFKAGQATPPPVKPTGVTPTDTTPKDTTQADTTTKTDNGMRKVDSTTELSDEAKRTADALNDYANNTLATQLQSTTAQFEKFKSGMDANLVSMIDNIERTFAARKDQMSQINQSTLQGQAITGNRAGRQRYATEIQTSILSAEERAGVQRLADLDIQEQQLIQQAKFAAQAQEWEAFNQYQDRVANIHKEKINSLISLNTLIQQEEDRIYQKQRDIVNDQRSEDLFNIQMEQHAMNIGMNDISVQQALQNLGSFERDLILKGYRELGDEELKDYPAERIMLDPLTGSKYLIPTETDETQYENITKLALDARKNGADNNAVARILNSGSYADAIYNAGMWLSDDETDRQVSPLEKDPVTGNPTVPSKFIMGYNFTSYATDPDWGYKVTGKLAKQEIAFENSNQVYDYVKKAKPEFGDEQAKSLANDIWETSIERGIDANILTAILEHESYLTTSNVAKNNNNPGGVTWNPNYSEDMKGTYRGAIDPQTGKPEGGHYVKFPTMKEGIAAVANNIARRYQGGATEDTSELNLIESGDIKKGSVNALKLEQAGLSNATRQQQLDFIYGKPEEESEDVKKWNTIIDDNLDKLISDEVGFEEAFDAVRRAYPINLYPGVTDAKIREELRGWQFDPEGEPKRTTPSENQTLPPLSQAGNIQWGSADLSQQWSQTKKYLGIQ